MAWLCTAVLGDSHVADTCLFLGSVKCILESGKEPEGVKGILKFSVEKSRSTVANANFSSYFFFLVLHKIPEK